MTLKNKSFRLSTIIFLLCRAGMAQNQNNASNLNVPAQAAARAKADFNRVAALARESGYVNLGEEPNIETQGNLIGFRSQNLMFSRRLDSRTYFIQDSIYGSNQPLNAFRGTDKELQRYAQQMLGKMSIPASEIKQTSVLQEMRQSAHPDPVSGALVKDEPYVANRAVLVTRQIEGLPVFSSRGLIRVTANRQVGFMELHWPEISQDIVTEAHSLDSLVQSGWRPPEKNGAKVEAVEAGIIHSPAIGFAMDIQPVIRVIYAPLDSSLGKKPVAYYDRNGNEVASPRQFAKERTEAPVKRAQ